VLVTRYRDAVTLRVNGKVDASNFGDMKMQLGSAYIPLMLAPSAKEILVIGFGSGTTAGAALLFPDLRVTCCEIEPAVVAASEHFHAVNHSPEESPRFELVTDDGRSYLQGSERSFDLIISEPSNPWIAGLTNLYSREYYRIARSRLAPGGIIAQWIQTYSFSPREYALVVRTMLDVFPHACFVRISEGDTILLASERPLLPSSETADLAGALIASTPIAVADLERHFGSRDVRTILLTHILLDTEGLRRLVVADREGAGVVNTDVNLRLEFDAPLHLFKRADTSEQISRQIQAAGSAEFFARMAESLECSAAHAESFHKLAYLFDKSVHPELVLALVDRGLELDPAEPLLLADRLVLAPPDGEGAMRAGISDLAAISMREANRVALAFLREGRRESASIAFERLTELAPNSATAWTNLARVYAALERPDDARAAIDKALAIDPLDERAAALSREIP
jgi:spermidine synthase